MKKIILLIALGFTLHVVLTAQSDDKKWAIGLHGGAAQYSGDLGNGFYSFDQAFYSFGALSLSRYLTPHWDVVLHGSYGDIGHLSSDGHFNAHMIQANLHVRFSFFKYENVLLRPFLLAGIGILNFDDVNSDKTFANTSRPVVGGGLAFKVSPSVAIRLQETLLISDYDAVDYQVDGGDDNYLLHSLGLEFNIGKMKDEDGDGVSDKKDMCPGTPQGVVVDDKGCPVDTDLDGIPDYLDACPTVPGVASAKGCPDRDGDGIADDKDDCPDDPGLAQYNGCPDRDGDGIIDKNDLCVDTPGLEQFSGCPDRDGDGIIDSEDACPDDAGIPEFQGCPDRDGDKIIDKEDLCPDTPGIPENKGCPAIAEEHKAILTSALYGIQFDFGKSTIKASSHNILDKVVQILSENPHYKLKIEGHTDSKGSEESNLKLSEERALAVEKYIEGKGIADDRISSKGYGETRPIADNETDAGRAKNRRVDLTIEF